MSALPLAVGSGRRRALVWVGRGFVAVALLIAAIWWSRTRNFAGLSYCEEHQIVECVDGLGAETLAPFVLWPVTAFVTFVVCLAAALAGPVAIRERIAWAAMIGCAVFVANRNNLIWAILVTGVAVWGVVSVTDDLPDPPH